jgi:phenylpropionate dioxygenase-like ring-hydroxylating dioxygenase large terminal subunit
MTEEYANFKSRELPYNWDFLIENFMDPAHIPFAHHSMQGSRSDGAPMPMQVLTDLVSNATHCEVAFQDNIRGKDRDGIVSFIAPCYYHFRLKDKETGRCLKPNSNTVFLTYLHTTYVSFMVYLHLSGKYKIALLGMAVPTVPGQCRLIFTVYFRKPISKKFPKWLDHAMSNRYIP